MAMSHSEPHKNLSIKVGRKLKSLASTYSMQTMKIDIFCMNAPRVNLLRKEEHDKKVEINK